MLGVGKIYLNTTKLLYMNQSGAIYVCWGHNKVKREATLLRRVKLKHGPNLFLTWYTPELVSNILFLNVWSEVVPFPGFYLCQQCKHLIITQNESHFIWAYVRWTTRMDTLYFMKNLYTFCHHLFSISLLIKTNTKASSCCPLLWRLWRWCT